MKKEDAEAKYMENYDLSHFRYLFLAGERTDSDTYHWVRNLLGIPVIDHWWQTESGWPMSAICMGLETLPVEIGSCGKAVPGYQIEIVDTDGNVVPPEREGRVTTRKELTEIIFYDKYGH